MIRDFSLLSQEKRAKRHNALAAANGRRKRGTISEKDYQEFIAEVDCRFQTPPIETATEIVKIGKIFERLTVVGFSKNKWGQTLAICTCECGGAATPTISALAARKAKSCGCLRESKDFTDSRVVASVRTTYKARAKQLNLEFSLDHYVVRGLILGSCFYCGTIPYREWNIVTKGGTVGLKCNGIDRVNNELGYTTTNVVSCCPRCNYAKRDMSLTEFSAWALRLAEHLRKQGVSVVGGKSAEN